MERKSTMNKVVVFNHPMIAHKLTLMRMKETGAKDFRDLLTEISMSRIFEKPSFFYTGLILKMKI